MAPKSKFVGRLVALGLAAYFVSKVFVAVDKLQDGKTATSMSTLFEEHRLMPSFSICFRKKRWHYQYKLGVKVNGTEVEQGLNKSRQTLDILSYLNSFSSTLKCSQV